MYVIEVSGKSLKLQFINKNLLVISANFRLFIKNQVALIGSLFTGVTVIVPQPYFPKPFLNISFFRNKLLFLDDAIESRETSKVYSDIINVIRPKFFTLPIEAMRKRVPLLYTRSLVNEVRRSAIEFDLIHAHRLDVGFAGVALKNMCNKPLVITCHGSDAYEFPFKDDFRYAVTRCVLNSVDRIIAVCQSDAEKLLSIGLPHNKLSIIPNGFDENLFKPIPQRLARETLGLPLDKKIILSVGTLHEIKGHSYLVNAMHLLSKVRSDVIMIVVGSGPLEAKLKKKIKDLDLRQSALLVGWREYNVIPTWMNASDIFVLPSLNEGFPAVIPEAMACGKPVIGTRVGGIPDAISSDNVGILVNPRDPESLAQAILEALNRRWEPEKISDYAQKYSLKNVVKQILRVYQKILSD